jgi:hypothetical protein
MAATQVSGKGGTVSLDGGALENLLRFTLNFEIDQHAGAHSDSDNWEENVGGVRRWSGTITVQADEGKVIAAINTAMLADAALAFIGTAYTAVTYSGNIKVSAINDIGADAQAGTVEEHTYPFVGHGALTPTTT